MKCPISTIIVFIIQYFFETLTIKSTTMMMYWTFFIFFYLAMLRMFGYHTWCRSHLQCYHLPLDRMSLWCPNPSFIFKKICNIETYVLTNQCCKVTLVKTMLLTSNLNVLPPTQRRLVFFFSSQVPSFAFSDTGLIVWIPEFTSQ